ncbi:hypothetical protein B0H14DRAFT_2627756 [Mycena olivaceomarginata]|nr:hypothetical protein B0H14DRAFT_2627756 [Mycena olivaceomarginata]
MSGWYRNQTGSPIKVFELNPNTGRAGKKNSVVYASATPTYPNTATLERSDEEMMNRSRDPRSMEEFEAELREELRKKRIQLVAGAGLRRYKILPEEINQAFPCHILAKMAINGSPRKRLSLKEICDALIEGFAWFRGNVRWKERGARSPCSGTRRQVGIDSIDPADRRLNILNVLCILWNGYGFLSGIQFVGALALDAERDARAEMETAVWSRRRWRPHETGVAAHGRRAREWCGHGAGRGARRGRWTRNNIPDPQNINGSNPMGLGPKY